MNYAQRLRIKNALGASQAQVADWQNRAADIEQRFGLPPRGGTPGRAQAPGSSPSSAPSPTAGAPRSSAAPVQTPQGGAAPPTAAAATAKPANWATAGRASKYNVGDTVSYGGRSHKILGLNKDGSLNLTP